MDINRLDLNLLKNGLRPEIVATAALPVVD
jgi:hypothetical protein